MVHPFWSFDNNTVTAVTDSTTEIDIARQLNAEKDREMERLSRQLEAQKKAQMHSNTQRRTSPILCRLYLVSWQNLTLRNNLPSASIAFHHRAAKAFGTGTRNAIVEVW